MEAKLGMRMLVAAGAVLVAGSVAQAGVVQSWSGSGGGGSDPFGNTWVLSPQAPTGGDFLLAPTASGDSYWGIPGIGLGTVAWPIQTPVTDLHITFTLPSGVGIDPNLDPNDFFATRFMNSSEGVFWNATITGNTVDFVAPDAAAALTFGDQFFVNVGFTALIGPGDFSFDAQWTDDVVGVPLPSSALMGLGLLGGLGGLALRRRRKQAVASL